MTTVHHYTRSSVCVLGGEGLVTCLVANDLRDDIALLINIFPLLCMFTQSGCIFFCYPPFFVFSLVLLYVCARTTRGLGRHSNTLPPKMPLLVNGIHKDIYR